MADRIDSTMEIDGHSQMGEEVRDHDDATREGRACRVRDHDDATREGRACRVRAPAPVHTGGTRLSRPRPRRRHTGGTRLSRPRPRTGPHGRDALRRVRAPAPVHTGGTRLSRAPPHRRSTPGGTRLSRPRPPPVAQERAPPAPGAWRCGACRLGGQGRTPHFTMMQNPRRNFSRTQPSSTSNR